MSYIFRNANIIDGTGKHSFKSDLEICNDKITQIGKIDNHESAIIIDASDKVLCPGFIDSHTHDDYALINQPLMEYKVSQGVTTVVTGNCGLSIAPLKIDKYPPSPLDLVCKSFNKYFIDFSDFVKQIKENPPSLNVLALVGHSTLRLSTMDRIDRVATLKEIKAMRVKLESSVESGAIGLSSGLFYPLSKFSSKDEITQILRPLKDLNILYTTHMRDEEDGIMESLEETLSVSRNTNFPILISHLKCAGKNNFGRSDEVLKKLSSAKNDYPISFDVYPYTAGSTMLDTERNVDAEKIIITWSENYPQYSGRDLDEVARENNMNRINTIKKIMPAGGVFFIMSESDVRNILSSPHSIIGSDGLPNDNHPHPRLWGTFPKILGHYAREEKIFSIEDAISKMTFKTAKVFGLKNRGIIKEGAFADIVLFDPNKIKDRSDFKNPKVPADGIDYVLVNGRIVWSEKMHSYERPGKFINSNDIGRHILD